MSRRYIFAKDEAGNHLRSADGSLLMVEVDQDWSDAPVSTGDLGKFEYDNLRTTDGVDISSRTKRREYMKATGVADPRDYREAGPKARAARDGQYLGETKAQAEDRRRDVYQAIQQHRRRR